MDTFGLPFDTMAVDIRVIASLFQIPSITPARRSRNFSCARLEALSRSPSFSSTEAQNPARLVLRGASASVMSAITVRARSATLQVISRTLGHRRGIGKDPTIRRAHYAVLVGCRLWMSGIGVVPTGLMTRNRIARAPKMRRRGV